MNFLDMLIIVIVLVMFIGFVYVNCILPQKFEKEKRQEELKKR